MTVLCYLKENVNKMKLTETVLAHNCFNSLMLIFWQNLMLTCMLYSMMQEEIRNFSESYAVYLVKFPCAICLHLVLYPEVMQGMKIMKFANNQASLFVESGSVISYNIGFL